jgi:PadR family transcriptional regulator
MLRSSFEALVGCDSGYPPISLLLTSERSQIYTPLGSREVDVNKTQLLQGTLDLLILRILELGPNHGWGISNRLQQMSKDGLKTSQGSLYPALHRLELRGEVRSEMTASENNRRARVYTITRAGRRRLDQETETWEAFALSMRRVLGEDR